MPIIFFATTNPGKQQEVAAFAAEYAPDVSVQFPQKDDSINVEESGTTFDQNALLKARAYQKDILDPTIIFVGDDSGIKIPALNNEPGVFTRRWAGHKMTDAEILAYCLEKMQDLHGSDRRAVFETVLVAVRGDEPPQLYRGQMWGHILEKPVDSTPIDGFPFRSVFWVDELDCPIYRLHDVSPGDRKGFLTHREQALKALLLSTTAPSSSG